MPLGQRFLQQFDLKFFLLTASVILFSIVVIMLESILGVGQSFV